MDILDDVKVTRDIKLFEEDRLRHCHKLTMDLIDNGLPDELISELYKMYDKDIDGVLNSIIKETYRILYGRVGSLKPTIKHVSALDEFVEEELRKQDCAYFCQTVLNDFEVNWHHLEWSLLLNKYKHICLLAARDHGKSYFGSLGYPLWRVYRYSRNSPVLYDRFGRLGYIFSMSTPRASELLEIIKDEVETNEFLRERLYPENKDNWSKLSLKFKNGAVIRARGFGSSVRGAHPYWIVCDDIIKDDVLYSDLQRQKDIDFFNAVVMNMLVPKGQMLLIGTPFHFKDLYSHIRPDEKIKYDFDAQADDKNGKGWVYKEYPAIDEDKRILWASRYNEADLELKQRHVGNLIFSREFLCKPVTNDSSLFPMSLLQRAFEGMEHIRLVENIEAFPIKLNMVVTGADFSISSKVGSDWTSFITFGQDDFRNRYLLNMYHEKGVGFYDQVAKLKTIGNNFKPDLMLLENNQFQEIYSQVMKQESSLPIKPLTTTRSKSDLYAGIPGLVLMFEQGRIKLPRGDQYSINMTNKFVNEFNHIGWTEKGIKGIGEHDDIVFSTWFCMKGFDYNQSGFVFAFA